MEISRRNALKAIAALPAVGSLEKLELGPGQGVLIRAEPGISLQGLESIGEAWESFCVKAGVEIPCLVVDSVVDLKVIDLRG